MCEVANVHLSHLLFPALEFFPSDSSWLDHYWIRSRLIRRCWNVSSAARKISYVGLIEPVPLSNQASGIVATRPASSVGTRAP